MKKSAFEASKNRSLVGNPSPNMASVLTLATSNFSKPQVSDWFSVLFHISRDMTSPSSKELLSSRRILFSSYILLPCLGPSSMTERHLGNYPHVRETEKRDRLLHPTNIHKFARRRKKSGTMRSRISIFRAKVRAFVLTE